MFQPKNPEADLAEFIGHYYDDPLGFVLDCFPWGEPGALKDFDGPDKWQHEYLTWLGEEVKARGFDGFTAVDPIRAAVASGHGIGKSTIQAWLVCWIMSTRPYCRGTITANTNTQLDTKTWAAVVKWSKLCLTAPWFEINTQRMYRKGCRESWFCAPQSCKEENSESFAGQHAADSTSFYIFDEASGIPEVIYQVAEGGVTDGEPMWFLFGNATRNTGSFHQACFGSQQHRWKNWSIDARESRFTNKKQIRQWIEDYGEDSDFVRVRVKGLPPSAGDAQFIDSARVYAAQKRDAHPLDDEPLIAGVDVSGGGSAWTVCWFRRGSDAKSIPPIRLTGQETRDRAKVVAVLAEALRTRPIAAMFIDSAFGAPIAERLKTLGFDKVHEINFGGDSPNRHQANQRAYQWNRMKDWLPTGAIPVDQRLEGDLTGPGFHLNKRDQLVLEAKDSMIDRGLASPDDGDALSLTFAQPVAPPKKAPNWDLGGLLDNFSWMSG